MGISRDIPPPVPHKVPTRPSPAYDGPRDVGVIIVAAGSGSRVGGSELKQFRWVAGKPMLLHSVQAFLARPDVCSVVCVLPDRYAADPPPWLFQSDLDRLLLSVGGAQRSDSVRHGLEDMAPEARVVLVHDAARPLVTDETIDRVIASARSGQSAIAAIPVVDTLKEVTTDGRIMRTVDRSQLWRAQTPQGFPRALLDDAYRAAAAQEIVATDDAALLERLGHDVIVVRGSERGMKVTEEGDFRRAELLFPLEDEGAGA
jgi:2-C-methyl-D-erythritol 4-phosphate cytidylyltransferase